MFRILCDPSSRSTELCLTEITCSDSQIFLSCAWLVFGSVILNLWCVCMVQPAGNYSSSLLIMIHKCPPIILCKLDFVSEHTETNQMTK